MTIRHMLHTWFFMHLFAQVWFVTDTHFRLRHTTHTRPLTVDPAQNIQTVIIISIQNMHLHCYMYIQVAYLHANHMHML